VYHNRNRIVRKSLATKLFIPPPRPNVVRRHRLIARLNAGLHRNLTLIAAPAGFGKTTLVSQGLSNREISERLILALDTVKGHNRRIYEKLQVQRRTEAVARARELGLL